MRSFAKIYTGVLQVTMLSIYPLFCCMPISSQADINVDSLAEPIQHEGSHNAPGDSRLHCKAIIKSNNSIYTRPDHRICIECVDLTNQSSIVNMSKSAKIEMEFTFKLDTQYFIYVTKPGYEMIILTFSTKGADSTSVYKFDFDLLPDESGNSTFKENIPSIHIVSNRTHYLF